MTGAAAAAEEDACKGCTRAVAPLRPLARPPLRATGVVAAAAPAFVVVVTVAIVVGGGAAAAAKRVRGGICNLEVKWRQ